MSDIPAKETEVALKIRVIKTENGTLKIAGNFGPPRREPSGIADRLDKLSDEWTSVSISFFKIMPFISSVGYVYADKLIEQELVKYLNENCISSEEYKTDDDEDASSFVVHEQDAVIISKILGRTDQAFDAARILKRSTLGSLLSEYEYFIQKIVNIFSEISPSSLNLSSEKIDFSDLENLDSIDSAKKLILQSRIQSATFNKSSNDVIEWIGDTFSINSSLPADLKSQFTEICQRRHLLIHNNGVVNEKYLRVCRDSGVDEAELAKVGDVLSVSTKYLRSATAIVYQVGYFILHMLWQKHATEFKSASFDALLRHSHDFLENDLTKMCRRLCKFAEHSEKQLDAATFAYFRLNEAQTYLFDKNLSEEDQNIQARSVGVFPLASSDAALLKLAFRREFQIQ